MTIRGYQKPLYILPFDHRGSFETGMFGWKGALTPDQTAQIAAAKQVIYDGFLQAIANGAPKQKAAILVDEQFGAAILRDAAEKGFTFACPAATRAYASTAFSNGTESIGGAFKAPVSKPALISWAISASCCGVSP